MTKSSSVLYDPISVGENLTLNIENIQYAPDEFTRLSGYLEPVTLPEHYNCLCSTNPRDPIDRVIFNPIDRVIFNDPATIIFWNDGTKTVVKCGPDDMFDKEKGLAMAIAKKFFGNKGNYNNIFKKYLNEV